MAEYRLNKTVGKRQLIRNGFRHQIDDTYLYRKSIYKDLMSLVITVIYDREDEEYFMNMKFINDYNGSEYPSYCQYGRNDFLKLLLNRRKRILNQFIKRGVVEIVEEDEK